MRIILAAAAVPSHFFAMAPFGWAAVASGHDVLAVTPPALCDAVAIAGLPVTAAGLSGDFAARYRAAGITDPKAVFAEQAAEMAPDLVGLAAQWRADLVVWEPTCFAAPVAAAALGIPSVRYLWGPDIAGRGTSGRDRMPDRIRSLARELGVDLDATPDWLTIDPCPPSLQVPTSAPWRHIRHVPYGPAWHIPRQVLTSGPRLTGPPRVVVTFGRSHGLADEHAALAPAVIRALSSADTHVVAAVSGDEAASLQQGLPPNAEIVPDCPLPALLDGAAAVVHHGGAGTMLAAALAGVPQIVLSVMPNLAFNGKLVAAAGAGVLITAESGVDEDAVRVATVAACEEPEYGLAAVGIRDEMLRQDPPPALIPELSALVTPRP
jgi:UDP:flavonoid glycosyltransferase YjiC (YdhE family)